MHASKKPRKYSKIKKRMINRYRFYDIFAINSRTQDIFPLFNIRINGVFYPQYRSIPRGPLFGGIDIYRLIGRDFSGTWDQTNRELVILGIL